MSRVQDPDAYWYLVDYWPFDELRFLVRSPIDETDMLPKLTGLGDERPDQVVRPGLLDQGGGRLLLRAEVLEY